VPLANIPPGLRDRPFTSAQARAAGLSHSSLRGAEWRRLFRSVWVHRSVPDTRSIRLAAVRLVLPDRAVACGLTAAWLYGADVRRETDLDVHVSFPKGGRVRGRPGVVVSQETLDPEDIVVIEGLRVTSPVRTAYDTLRLSSGLERLVVADALTALRRTSVEEIGSYFRTHRRRRNVRVGERLVDLIEPRSESPMETRLRTRLVESGLPRPVAQYELRDGAGGFVARLDLAYPEQRVAVEYDGAWHWGQRRHDDRRRDAARALGWIVIVVSADDVYAGAVQMCGRVGAALRSRATRSSSATKTA
jgi:very-short-patch-repair endonuclease